MSESQNLPKIVIEGMGFDREENWQTHEDFPPGGITEFFLEKISEQSGSYCNSYLALNLSQAHVDGRSFVEALWDKPVKFRVTIEVIE